jgi:hypothetical protein
MFWIRSIPVWTLDKKASCNRFHTTVTLRIAWLPFLASLITFFMRKYRGKSEKITKSVPTTITAGGRKRWRALIYLFIPIYVQCSEKNNAANAETEPEISFLLLGRRPVYSHHHSVISLIRLQGNLREQIKYLKPYYISVQLI